MRVYRNNAVGKDGKAMVLRTADTPTKALGHLRDALGVEYDHDVSGAELVRRSEEEQAQSS